MFIFHDFSLFFLLGISSEYNILSWVGRRIWDPIQGFRAIFHELNIPTVATAASITSHKLQTMGDDLTNLPNIIQTMHCNG